MTVATTGNIEHLGVDALKGFVDVARIAGRQIATSQIGLEVLPAPHKPPSTLPRGMMAVYSFFLGGRCLKVGKVGAKSQARYVSQHYIPASSRSNLARSLISAQAWVERYGFSEATVGAWIKANSDRMNFLVPEELGTDVLSLLEAFLHCTWKPEFEGKTS